MNCGILNFDSDILLMLPFTKFAFNFPHFFLANRLRKSSPIQHSSLAQGDVLTTSGGSTPTLRHKTRATLTVFIWRKTE